MARSYCYRPGLEGGVGDAGQGNGEGRDVHMQNISIHSFVLKELIPVEICCMWEKGKRRKGDRGNKK